MHAPCGRRVRDADRRRSCGRHGPSLRAQLCDSHGIWLAVALCISGVPLLHAIASTTADVPPPPPHHCKSRPSPRHTMPTTHGSWTKTLQTTDPAAREAPADRTPIDKGTAAVHGMEPQIKQLRRMSSGRGADGYRSELTVTRGCSGGEVADIWAGLLASGSGGYWNGKANITRRVWPSEEGWAKCW